MAARAAKNATDNTLLSRTPHTTHPPSKPDEWERIRSELGTLSPGLEVIAVLGLLTAIGGGILIKITFSWTQALIGLVAMFVGVMMYAFAVHAGRDATTLEMQPVDLKDG